MAINSLRKVFLGILLRLWFMISMDSKLSKSIIFQGQFYAKDYGNFKYHVFRGLHEWFGLVAQDMIIQEFCKLTYLQI